MIQIVYRHRIAPSTEPGFVEAWERSKTKMLGRVQGFLGASVFRNASDASELVTVSRWSSVEDWKRYWGEGVPEPEGELTRNEILIELKSVIRAPESAPKRSKRSSNAPTRKR